MFSSLIICNAYLLFSQSPIARILCIIWMFISVVFLATITANISSDLIGTDMYNVNDRKVSVLKDTYVGKIANER